MHDPGIATSEQMPSEQCNTNLIGVGQWDSQWSLSRAPRRLRPWRDYLSWRFAQVFREHVKSGDRVLEIGCGGSRFLPYFAKDLGAEVWGLDFAPAGVASARAALLRAGVKGTIVEGDLFTTRDVPQNAFDVVFSGGFIEHFTDTADILQHIVRFAKPGTGLVITEVPNVGGWPFSKLQKRLDPELYAQHVLITRSMMDAAHAEAGAKPVCPAEYFGTLALSVINYNRALSHVSPFVHSALRRSLEISQFLVTAPLWALRAQFETAAFSPLILGVYRRT